MRNIGQSSGAEMAPGGVREGLAYGHFDATGMIATAGAIALAGSGQGWRAPAGAGGAIGHSQWLASLENWQAGAVRS